MRHRGRGTFFPPVEQIACVSRLAFLTAPIGNIRSIGGGAQRSSCFEALCSCNKKCLGVLHQWTGLLVGFIYTFYGYGHFKGIIYSKMAILSSFTHPCVVPNMHDFLSLVEHHGRYFTKCPERSVRIQNNTL